MGGFVLDIFVLYLIRVSIRFWRRRGTSSWMLQQANIENISRSLATWGCPLAEVTYVFKVGDETYSGSDEIPFIWRSSAEAYVHRHPKGSTLVVRVKPGDPETSVLNVGDQVRSLPQTDKARSAI